MPVCAVATVQVAGATSCDADIDDALRPQAPHELSTAPRAAAGLGCVCTAEGTMLGQQYTVRL
jgi:hypothetical protein